MTEFQYRPRKVIAQQFNGEHLSALPQWVQDYKLKAPGPYGNSTPGTSATHDLLIPTPSGVITVQKNDWIILEDGKLFAVHDREFAEIFEEVPGKESAPPPEAVEKSA